MTVDYLFESAWEVCNKVGGIYTVVSSKAALVNSKYKNYFLIGPYFREKAILDFIQQQTPKELVPAFEALEKRGVGCVYGEWTVKGNPKAILINFQNLYSERDFWRTYFWEHYSIDSLNASNEFDEPMLWSVAVSLLLEEIEKTVKGNIIGHFHEWMAGFSLLKLKKSNSRIKTVFTTHATILGRSIAGCGDELYELLNKINPVEEARKRNIIDKYTAEKACALNTDVFTTVSEITGIETELLLGRKPDVLLLNGLDLNKFPSFEEASFNHRKFRERIREFLIYYFFPYYKIDTEKTLFMFIMGRYEFRNKGMDIFIKALGSLNRILKEKNSEKTIISFFFIPSKEYGIKDSVLDSKNRFEEVKSTIERNQYEIQNNIISGLFSNSNIKNLNVFSEEIIKDLKNKLFNFPKDGHPSLTTHKINEYDDSIIKLARKVGITNSKEDKVKLISYPIYLSGGDGLLDLKYYDAIQGCHFGIFPSYYEPWGYTPLESAALGVPCLTTDLAGFGRFIKENRKQKGGIYVLDRFNKKEDEVLEQFVDILLEFIQFHHNERVEEKITAKKMAELTDWKEFINNYFKAYNMALSKGELSNSELSKGEK